MKIIKKIICVAAALAMLALTCVGFASCAKKQSGHLLATYKGGKVYESDVADWQLFFLTQKTSEISAASDIQAKIREVNDETTKFYVQIKAFKQLLEDKGIATISDSSIKNYAEKVLIPQIEENNAKNGGYAFWKKLYNVTDNFIYDYAEEQLVTAYLEKYIMDNYGVTEELINEYWEANSYKYIVVPSYEFDVIMVTVAEKDVANKEAWEAAKAEAQGYIDRIKGGEDFAAVKADAISKSNTPKIAEAMSVVDSVPYLECEGFDDAEAHLTAINEFIEEYTEQTGVALVEYADPYGDSKEYTLWYSYSNLLNEFYTKNALVTLEIGQTTAEPIRHLSGYEIIKLLNITDTTEFLNPKTNEDVYNDIYTTLYDQLWDEGNGPASEEFEKQLAEDYNIEIVYKYAESST